MMSGRGASEAIELGRGLADQTARRAAAACLPCYVTTGTGMLAGGALCANGEKSAGGGQGQRKDVSQGYFEECGRPMGTVAEGDDRPRTGIGCAKGCYTWKVTGEEAWRGKELSIMQGSEGSYVQEHGGLTA